MFNKKGVSVLIEYILLLAMVIVLSTIVYSFLSSFVPKEPLECSDGVAVYVSDYVYQCDTNTLNIELKNNGKFNSAGYFIKAKNSTAIELATIDISQYTTGSVNGAILVSTTQSANSFSVNSKITNIFSLASQLGNLTAIEIIPIRYEEIEGKTRLLSCTNAKIKQSLSCYNQSSQSSQSNQSIVINATFVANYNNLSSKNFGSRPSGVPGNANWWYFDVILNETGGITGITINQSQLCYTTQGFSCPSSPNRTDYSPSDGCWCNSIETNIQQNFGTNYINPGGSIYRHNAYVYFSPGFTYTTTDTFWGKDDNNNNLSSEFSFIVTS